MEQINLTTRECHPNIRPLRPALFSAVAKRQQSGLWSGYAIMDYGPNRDFSEVSDPVSVMASIREDWLNMTEDA